MNSSKANGNAIGWIESTKNSWTLVLPIHIICQSGGIKWRRQACAKCWGNCGRYPNLPYRVVCLFHLKQVQWKFELNVIHHALIGLSFFGIKSFKKEGFRLVINRSYKHYFHIYYTTLQSCLQKCFHSYRWMPANGECLHQLLVLLDYNCYKLITFSRVQHQQCTPNNPLKYRIDQHKAFQDLEHWHTCHTQTLFNSWNPCIKHPVSCASKWRSEARIGILFHYLTRCDKEI